jgi:hypothetical protein
MTFGSLFGNDINGSAAGSVIANGKVEFASGNISLKNDPTDLPMSVEADTWNEVGFSDANGNISLDNPDFSSVSDEKVYFRISKKDSTTKILTGLNAGTDYPEGLYFYGVYKKVDFSENLFVLRITTLSTIATIKGAESCFSNDDEYLRQTMKIYGFDFSEGQTMIDYLTANPYEYGANQETKLMFAFTTLALAGISRIIQGLSETLSVSKTKSDLIKDTYHTFIRSFVAFNAQSDDFDGIKSDNSGTDSALVKFGTGQTYFRGYTGGWNYYSTYYPTFKHIWFIYQNQFLVAPILKIFKSSSLFWSNLLYKHLDWKFYQIYPYLLSEMQNLQKTFPTKTIGLYNNLIKKIYETSYFIMNIPDGLKNTKFDPYNTEGKFKGPSMFSETSKLNSVKKINYNRPSNIEMYSLMKKVIYTGSKVFSSPFHPEMVLVNTNNNGFNLDRKINLDASSVSMDFDSVDVSASHSDISSSIALKFPYETGQWNTLHSLTLSEPNTIKNIGFLNEFILLLDQSNHVQAYNYLLSNTLTGSGESASFFHFDSDVLKNEISFNNSSYSEGYSFDTTFGQEILFPSFSTCYISNGSKVAVIEANGVGGGDGGGGGTGLVDLGEDPVLELSYSYDINPGAQVKKIVYDSNQKQIGVYSNSSINFYDSDTSNSNVLASLEVGTNVTDIFLYSDAAYGNHNTSYLVVAKSPSGTAGSVDIYKRIGQRDGSVGIEDNWSKLGSNTITGKGTEQLGASLEFLVHEELDNIVYLLLGCPGYNDGKGRVKVYKYNPGVSTLWSEETTIEGGTSETSFGKIINVGYDNQPNISIFSNQSYSTFFVDF